MLVMNMLSRLEDFAGKICISEICSDELCAVDEAKTLKHKERTNPIYTIICNRKMINGKGTEIYNEYECMHTSIVKSGR